MRFSNSLSRIPASLMWMLCACALAMQSAGSRADDRFDPRDGWSMSSPHPHVDAAQQMASGSSEFLWAQKASGSAISRPESTLRVRRKRTNLSSSTQTDRQQRIKLPKPTAETSLVNPLRTASNATQVQPADEPVASVADETPADETPAARVRGAAVLPASHELFNERPSYVGGESYDEVPIDTCRYVPQEGEVVYGDAGPYFADDCGPVGCDIACGDGCLTEPGCACGSNPCVCAAGPKWVTGFELVMVKPRFDDNVAFTIMENDGATADTITDMEFDYDRDASVRVWMGYEFCSGIGGRATYWHFDPLRTRSTVNPPDNGFGFILHPDFGGIDISTNVPTDTFTASASIEAFAVDLETTKRFCSPKWSAIASGGLRYAEIEQSYFAERRQQDDTSLGTIDFAHHLKGFGPTIAIRADRQMTNRLQSFLSARASLLFGDGESRLVASEGAAPALTTVQTSGRDDLLPIGEMQVGLYWQPHKQPRKVFQPFLTTALEGQVWSGAGNSSSEDGDVGFFGVSFGGGTMW